MSGMSKARATRLLKKTADTMARDDLDKLVEKKDELDKKLSSGGALKRFATDISLLFSLVTDYAKGRYREVPWRVIAAVAGALFYVLNPIDVIPDFLAIFGLADDAVVVAACLSLIEKDLKAYHHWKIDHADSA